MTDRGRDSTSALTEMRTILNRARTALEYVSNPARCDDPDREEMELALREIIELTDRWQRTGKSKKCIHCGYTESSYYEHHSNFSGKKHKFEAK